jgi:hypothetical protein
MENRTEYNNGLTIPELCKRVLGYEMQESYDKSIQRTRQRWKLGTDGKYYVGDDMCSVGADYYDKVEQDKKRSKQMKQMIKRTRQKYRSGSRYNDTPTNKYQYYLLPPKLQQTGKGSKLWRCVHIIVGQNDYLLEPLLMRDEQVSAGLEKQRKENGKLSRLTKEEAENLMTQTYIKMATSRHSPKKEEINKVIADLKKENNSIPPWAQYKPDYEEIGNSFSRVLSEKVEKYRKDRVQDVFLNRENKERDQILRELVIADYKKKEYILKYDWELLEYLKSKDKR